MKDVIKLAVVVIISGWVCGSAGFWINELIDENFFKLLVTITFLLAFVISTVAACNRWMQ